MNGNETTLIYQKRHHRNVLFMVALFLVVILLFFLCIGVGSSNLSFTEFFKALFGQSTITNNRIVWSIRMPRALAALIAGAGLSLSGLIMQTILGNPMASPSTLGVSNAAVFGANLSILAIGGGFISTGNNVNAYLNTANPYLTSFMAFVFAGISTLAILGLCKIRSFSPNTVVLAGIAIGSIWTAGTTIMQYYASDVGLSAAVIWNFGDLGRATYLQDLIMAVVVIASAVYFYINYKKYNCLLSGEAFSKSVGVSLQSLRFISLFLASLITACCVSFLGIIGFVGIICPHIMKRIIGENHRYSISASLLSGSVLLLFADILSRLIGNGSTLPIGAITSIIGAPFFLYIIFSKKERQRC